MKTRTSQPQPRLHHLIIVELVVLYVARVIVETLSFLFQIVANHCHMPTTFDVLKLSF